MTQDILSLAKSIIRKVWGALTPAPAPAGAALTTAAQRKARLRRRQHQTAGLRSDSASASIEGAHECFAPPSESSKGRNMQETIAACHVCEAC